MALLTEDQHAEFKEAFRLLDTEEKGEITLKQLNSMRTANH
jgi:Ca2+-binding EF-hand superfamily protein